MHQSKGEYYKPGVDETKHLFCNDRVIRRYRFLTHRRVQFKLASQFVLWFLVFLAAFGFIYFLHFSSQLDDTDYMTINDQILTRTLLVDQALELAVWFGSALVAFVFLIWCYLVVYSHRLTGPVHKLEMMLREATEKKQLPQIQLSFRKHDAFHNLAIEFNQFVEMVRNHSDLSIQTEDNKESKVAN